MKIAGPAYIVYQYGASAAQSLTAFSADDINVSIERRTREIAPKHLNGQYDELYLYSTADIKFKPLAWSNPDVFYPWGGKTVGSVLFGDTSRPTKIYSADGQCYTFKRTALFGSGSLGLGLDKDIIGECTIKALPDYTDSDASLEGAGTTSFFYTIDSTAFTPPALTDEKIFSIPFKVDIVDGEEVLPYKTEDGVEVSFEPTLTEHKKDGVPWDYIFGGVKVSGKFLLSDLTYTDFKAVVDDAAVNVARGRSICAANALSMSISPVIPQTGDPVVTFGNVIFSGNTEHKFSATEGRFGEIEFTALARTFGTPSFAITAQS